ncbi:Repressor CsoR of the copZA operon [Micrococcus lylae]|uniref:Repressor CsoR of the copZA operon n=1 Tax=Micrococcus lylae TaxID=1273 RepID=A0A1R4IZ31_9MICC|nr:metal-sensitive transcriptional regulator [Micrococcus lylae]TFH98500.1 transcriptional regulator [Micrococcus lylae]SJN25121.1 Repressor CsoR of the copZA operon [Micrococcus lylae]
MESTVTSCCDDAEDHADAGHTHGYGEQKHAYLKRLRRIEGQIRGLQRMVDEDVYCIDILTQVSAATKSLQSVSLALVQDHLRHCVAEAAVQADHTGRADIVDAKVAEATAAIGRLLR